MRKGAELVLLHWTTGVYLKDIFVFAVVVIYTCEATPPFSFFVFAFFFKKKI